MEDKIILKFSSTSENESLARSVVACYALRLNPSVEEMNDIKTAVSEAVTNAIVHGYQKKAGEITMEASTENKTLHINIIDDGVGINDLSEAMEPFFSSAREEEHSGLGFTIMQSFMDEVKVKSNPGSGTSVFMSKEIKSI